MEIFVAVGKNFEIGKNNQLPWNTIKKTWLGSKIKQLDVMKKTLML